MQAIAGRPDYRVGAIRSAGPNDRYAAPTPILSGQNLQPCLGMGWDGFAQPPSPLTNTDVSEQQNNSDTRVLKSTARTLNKQKITSRTRASERGLVPQLTVVLRFVFISNLLVALVVAYLARGGQSGR